MQYACIKVEHALISYQTSPCESSAEPGPRMVAGSVDLHLMIVPLDAFLELIALVGEGDFNPLGMTDHGSTSSQRPLMGNSDDQAAAHAARAPWDFGVFFDPRNFLPCRRLPIAWGLARGRKLSSQRNFPLGSLCAACVSIEMPGRCRRIGERAYNPLKPAHWLSRQNFRIPIQPFPDLS
jgi:hypothetical protein